MLRCLFVDQSVPAMWRSRAATSFNADWPSGNDPTTWVRLRISPSASCWCGCAASCQKGIRVTQCETIDLLRTRHSSWPISLIRSAVCFCSLWQGQAAVLAQAGNSSYRDPAAVSGRWPLAATKYWGHVLSAPNTTLYTGTPCTRCATLRYRQSGSRIFGKIDLASASGDGRDGFRAFAQHSEEASSDSKP